MKFRKSELVFTVYLLIRMILLLSDVNAQTHPRMYPDARIQRGIPNQGQSFEKIFLYLLVLFSTDVRVRRKVSFYEARVSNESNLMKTIKAEENANKKTFSNRTTTTRSREVKIQLHGKMQEQKIHCVSATSKTHTHTPPPSPNNSSSLHLLSTTLYTHYNAYTLNCS